MNESEMFKLLEKGETPAVVSLKKWEAVRRSRLWDRLQQDPFEYLCADTCALCETYFRGWMDNVENSCRDCPLYKAEKLHCDQNGSLYMKVIDAIDAGNRTEFLEASQNMIDALKKLVEKGA